MKSKIILGALLMTSMTSMVANAALTGADLAAANAYLARYPEISSKAPWIRDAILGANSLQQANDQLKGNSYYNGSVVVPVNQISVLTSVPALTLTDSSDVNNPDNSVPVSLTPHLDGEHGDVATLRYQAEQRHYADLAAKRDLRVKKEEFNDSHTTDHDNSVPVSLTPHLDGEHGDVATLRYQAEQRHYADLAAKRDLRVKKEEFNDSHTTDHDNSTPVSTTPHLDGEHGDVATLRYQAEQRHYADLAAKRNFKQKATESNTVNAIQRTQDVVNNNADALVATQSVVRQNARVSSSNSQRLNNVESHQNQQDRTISDNKKHASAGISAAFAQANIPQVTESQRFSMGAGVGTYNGEQALAVGASFHASQNTIVKLTVSDDTQSNVGAGAGVAIGW
ncbi:YadA C-terminal domain-containing protein [Budvicia aquatica]|uniref:YadA-like C-terminal region n=1 Tax=Budvicia aquatica TaxID=82979 RepID=A0A2C6DI87_9GAMM|nr:YadA C-terminal domain-containing protein [Budvicia aquatica]PHI28473.1 hypothetical protein CRN84_03590 [Budvicia aquatica]VFS46410.1 YadA-like C-terminal region [Budvicia aquatica]